MFKLIVFILCFHAFSVFAITVDCEPSTTGGYYHKDQWSTIHSTYEIKPSGINITLGNNIPDWTVLYELDGASIDQTTGGNPNIYYVLYVQNAKSVGSVAGSVIYATNTSGIGISLDYDVGKPLKAYPSFYDVGSTYEGGADFVIGATIKFWKIPGQISMTNSSISISGPEIGVMYANVSGGYVMQSNSPGRIYNFNGGTGYLSGSRVLHATLMFQPATCNIEGDNVKVDMGEYDGTGGHSEWRDANFKLVCPDSYGYGGKYDTDFNQPYANPDKISPGGIVSPNVSKNGRVQISIVPYTEVVDANKGIIALDGTGSKGYGIQLAWGDYSSQSSVEPVNPVVLNSYVDANSLNSGFSAGDTPIGGNAFIGTDNTIKMAARYVRTTGDTAPGPANAIVQVIANYQ